MYGFWNGAKRILRRGTTFALALALCTAAVGAGAAEVKTEDSRLLVPVGHTVGIKLFARGVLVVKLPEEDSPARECGLKEGDVILSCGGSTVTSTEHFQSLLQKTDGAKTDLQVHRNGVTMSFTVDPEANDQGVYCIGAWIRDSMAGIGTMTYYDPATGEFGALGHGIADVDTAQLMPFSNGEILPSTVKAVKKGEAGCAGELRGDFDLKCDMGDLYANTDCGVFGTLDAEASTLELGEAIPTGTAEEGGATIRANVEGDCVEEYDIQIEKVISNAPDGRDMVLSVTDPELIAQTGGIVQGMSGSPILQNGKLVGAVTHVLLNDATRGYGISIETMLEAAK